MDSYMSLLIALCACVCAWGEPLSNAGTYARQHARGYRPVAYAALSLHAPIPLLHVMSRVPLTSAPAPAPDVHDTRAAASGLVPTYLQPLYAAGTDAQAYTPHAYATAPNALPPYNPRVYNPHAYNEEPNGRPYDPPKYAASVNEIIRDGDAESDEPIVLYARPNPQGGYTYRRRPIKKRAPPAPTPAPPRPEAEPIIIRVQKYRIIRDR